MVDGAGRVILPVSFVTPRRNTILVERQRLQPLDLFRGVGRGELDLVAGVVAELERGRLDGEAVGALDEAAPVGAAAEFAVGHHLEPDLLLHGDHVADALVLQFAEFGVADLPGRMAAEGLRAARRGAAGCRHDRRGRAVGPWRRHSCTRSPEKFYSLNR